jgi:hypothetical protein
MQTSTFKNYAEISDTVVLVIAGFIGTGALLACFCYCKKRPQASQDTMGNVHFSHEGAHFLPGPSRGYVGCTRHDLLERPTRRSAQSLFSPRHSSTWETRRPSMHQAPYQPIHTQVIKEQIYQDPQDFKDTLNRDSFLKCKYLMHMNCSFLHVLP